MSKRWRAGGQPGPIDPSRGRLARARTTCAGRPPVASSERLRPELAAVWERHGKGRSGSWAETSRGDWQARSVHGMGIRDPRRCPRPGWQGSAAAADVRERMAGAANRSAACRRLPERRAGRAGDRCVEGRGSGPRPGRAGYLRRRRQGRHGRISPSGQPALCARVAVPHRRSLLGARPTSRVRVLRLRD